MSNDKTVSSQIDDFFKETATTTFGPINFCANCNTPMYNNNAFCSDSCAKADEQKIRDLLLLSN